MYANSRNQSSLIWQGAANSEHPCHTGGLVGSTFEVLYLAPDVKWLEVRQNFCSTITQQLTPS
jgi:hypothetical protein